MSSSFILSPRFCDTDALGHISNVALPAWFEQGREAVFEIFNPGMKMDSGNLILKLMTVDFVGQMYYGHSVEVRTSVPKVGSSSFTVYQEAWQKGECCAKGEAIMVYFDFDKQQKLSIPDDIRAKLLAK
jgi:acyl-CoA thioester hydrolase